MENKIYSLKSVSKIYDIAHNQTKALENVSLDIFKGESVAIMGVSGSGKSTLLNILGLLIRPTSCEEFTFFSEDAMSFNDSKMSRERINRLGFCFQDLELLPDLTVYKNIELALFMGSKYKIKEFKNVINNILMRLNIQDLKNKKVAKLSGGQCQRVAIARCVVNDPDVLLLDEPTSSLDISTSEEILSFLNELKNEGKTIIVVTHDIKVANKMDKIYKIEDGKILG